MEVIPEDRAEDTTPEQVTISHSDDVDAAWIKKGNKTHYGYKVHMAADSTHGLVLGGHVTPANRGDMNELEKVLPKLPPEVKGLCYADKGYTSKHNRDVVRRYGFKDGIMSKAVRGKKLGHWEQVRNKCLFSIRSGIERIFGTFKRSRYLGQAKVEQEFFPCSPER